MAALVLIGAIAGAFWFGREAPSLEPGGQTAEFSNVGHDPKLQEQYGLLAGNNGQADVRNVVVVSGDEDFSGLRGRLLGPGGQGVEGARIGWARVSKVAPGDYAEEKVVVDDRLSILSEGAGEFVGPLPELSAKTGAGQQGRTELLWCAAPGYRVAFQSREVGLGADWNVADWKLDKGQDTRVFVTDEAGNPLEGVSVIQEALPPFSVGTFQGGALARFGGIFRQASETDSTGLAGLPFLEGRSRISASHGDQGERQWIGSDPRSVNLVLGASALIAGQVHAPDDEAVPRGVRVHWTWRGDPSANAGTIDVVDGVNWGPISMAIAPDNSLLVWASAAGLLSRRVTLNPLNPGELRTVDLELERGSQVWAFVCDVNENPVSGALVRAQWRDDSGLNDIRVRPQSLGYASFDGVPDGPVTLIATAPGFRQAKVMVHCPEIEPTAHVLEMLPGATLAGQCLRDGKPCTDFEVIVWSPELARSEVRQRFSTQSGRFQLFGIPKGQVHVIAVSPSGEMSQRVDLNLPDADSDGGTPKVSLALGGPVGKASGRLVSEDGVPLRGGRIQVLFERIGVGPIAETGESGEFELHVALSGASGVLELGAKKYSTRKLEVDFSQTESLIIGDVVLFSTRDLEVSLLVESGLAMGKIRVQCLDAELPDVIPNSKGVALINGLGVGIHGIVVDLGGGVQSHFSVEIAQEGLTKVELDLRNCGELVVEVLNVPERAGAGLSVEVIESTLKYQRPNRQVSEYTVDTSVRFSTLPAGDYTVKILGMQGQVVGAASTKVKTGEKTTVTVDLETQPHVIQVIDHEGRPLPGVHTHLSLVGNADMGTSTTNGSGQIFVYPPGSGVARLCLWKEGIGHHWNIPIAFPAEPALDAIVVTMECAASLQLRLTDPTGPLCGQLSRLAGDGYSKEVSVPKETDGGGYVTFDHLSPGSYQLRVNAPGHWPYARNFDATRNAEVQEILIPRLTEMVVEVREANGQPIVGEQVQVWTVDYDKDTRQWQNVGVLRVEPADWKTDERGRITFPSLPEGNYLCAVNVAGVRTEVPIEARPERQNLASIELKN